MVERKDKLRAREAEREAGSNRGHRNHREGQNRKQRFMHRRLHGACPPGQRGWRARSDTKT